VGSPRWINQTISFDARVTHPNDLLSLFFPEKLKLLWTCSWDALVGEAAVKRGKI
jgi:hypothetical protein